jgi:hypothetical protein
LIEPSRFTLRQLTSGFVAELMFEKGFLYTFKELLLRPGLTIDTILSRRPGPLNEPVKFICLSVALVTVFMNIAQPYGESGYASLSQEQLAMQEQAGSELAPMINSIGAFIADSQHTLDGRFRARQAQEALELSLADWINQSISSWMNVLLLAAIPMFALCSRLVFPRRLNLAEHAVVQSSIYGVQCILAVVVVAPFILVDQTLLATWIYFGISLGYQVFAWAQFFRFKGLFDGFKCFLLFALTYGVYMLLAIVLVGLLLAGTFIELGVAGPTVGQ